MRKRYHARSILLGATFAAMVLLGAAPPPEPVELHFQPGEPYFLAAEVDRTSPIGTTKHLFLFRDYSGSILIAPGQAAASIRLGIDAQSAEVRGPSEDLDKGAQWSNLLAGDILQAGAHPRITFETRAVRPKSKVSFDIEGDLTVRGTSRPVTMRLTVESESNTEVAVKGDFVLDLNRFGIEPPSAYLGIVRTSPEIPVHFYLHAVRASGLNR